MVSTLNRTYRTGVSSPDLANYEQRLSALGTVTTGNDRAIELEDMAWWADMLAKNARFLADHSKWNAVALICRAVAATERGYILVDPDGIVSWLAGSNWAWAALIQNAGQHAGRAEILHVLFEQLSADIPEGAALVLDDIAATELAAAAVTG